MKCFYWQRLHCCHFCVFSRPLHREIVLSVTFKQARGFYNVKTRSMHWAILESVSMAESSSFHPFKNFAISECWRNFSITEWHIALPLLPNKRAHSCYEKHFWNERFGIRISDEPNPMDSMNTDGIHRMDTVRNTLSRLGQTKRLFCQ